MQIRENVSLKGFTTFKIGGAARYFSVATESADIPDAVAFARKNKIPFVVLGGGSNVLISDEGFPGLVIKMDILGIDFEEGRGSGVEVIVGAGESWDDLVRLAVEKNLYGLENLSGIPGTVGAAPIQNIGAYGSEVKDTISFVEAFDFDSQEFRIMSAKDCKFGYRDSIFKTSAGRRLIVTRVGFLLKKKGELNLEYKDIAAFFAAKKAATPSDVRSAVLQIRAKKFPDLRKFGTAGSFFKNPIVSEKFCKELKEKHPDLPVFPAGRGKKKLSLAWILDKVCDLKGNRAGAVGSFENQALVLVNYGGASAFDVSDFADNIALIIKQKTGIEVEREVQTIS